MNARHEGDDPVERALRGFDARDGRPPVIEGADVTYAVEETAVGALLLATRRDGALLASAFAPDEAAVEALAQRLAQRVSARVLRMGTSGPRAAKDLDAVRRQLHEYLDGRRRSFDLRVDPVLASGFQRQVLDGLATAVPYADRTTYGALAAAIGRPTAARAVGTALGANPLCVVLPCHRVVGASGALTGYAGGLAAKRLLLDLERRVARS